MSKVYIVVSTYQQTIDHYGGRMTNFDIHEVFPDPEKAKAYITGANPAGPSGYPRSYSIVERDLSE
jgi:hypothetical protein